MLYSLIVKPIPEILAENRFIILFDGLCGFCDSCVDFVIRHDARGDFKFASLQSELGQRLLQHFSFPTNYFESQVLIENGKVFRFSTASLRIAKKLGGGWPLLYVFIFLPRVIRDGAYRYFANHRYQWFGRSESCRIPSSEIQSRFIE